MDLFRDLGGRIESAWRDVDQDEEKFPAIAAEFLRNADLVSKVSPWDILEWGLKQTEFPRQKDINANFGDPPITLYTAPKFYIDVYFWFEGTTAIHQHGFCGAFQVLHGSSIHSWYEFECEDAVNKFVQIGRMSLKVCELLETGAVQEIWGGRQYIHSLFHLDSPSATICVRTERSPLDLPQYTYLKPSLALDPFYEEETIKKKLQIISAMARAKRPNMDDRIRELIEESDFQSTFQLLQMANRVILSNRIDKLFGVGDAKARFESFIETARKRHGKRIDTLTAVFEFADRTNEIIRRRSFITDPEHRFFFALLLNVDNKESIFSLIKQRYPDAEPREKVLDWVFDLSQTRVVGSNQNNALGIEPFDEIDLSIFESLLDGRSADEAIVSVRGQFSREKLADVNDSLADRAQNIRNAVIFSSLFR